MVAEGFEATGMTVALRGVALWALHREDVAGAQATIEGSRQLCDATHEKWVRALLEFASAQLAWQRGDRAQAEALIRGGLAQVLQLGDQCAIAEGLEQLAVGARP